MNTELTHDQVIHEHKMIAKDMDEMLKSNGWQRFAIYINQELETAFAAMEKAHSGDAAMEAKAQFVLLRKLRDLPARMKDTAIQSFTQLEMEVPEVPATKPSRNRMP